MSRQPGGWLRKQPFPFQRRNSSLVQRLCAENVTGLKASTEDANSRFSVSGRGAFRSAVKSNRKVWWSVREVKMLRWVTGNESENLSHRKTKGFPRMAISVGLVGPKARAKAVVDGHPVNIPEPEIVRQRELVLKWLKNMSFGICSRESGEQGEAEGRHLAP